MYVCLFFYLHHLIFLFNVFDGENYTIKYISAVLVGKQITKYKSTVEVKRPLVIQVLYFLNYKSM